MAGSSVSDDHPPPGVVELREDVPLKSVSGDPRRCAGPRLIAGAFAALTAAITLALLTQIYYGDYEVVPHGSVATSQGGCSRGGAGLLRAGGSAADAAAAAALCLAVASPASTAIDASGSLLYWEYRRSHKSPPTLLEWGGGPWESWAGPRPPRLVAALARLHAAHGALPWPRVLQPAIDFANSTEDGAVSVNNAVVEMLRGLQHNNSAELCAAWRCGALVRASAAVEGAAEGGGEGEGGWRAFAPAHAAPALARALSGDLQGALSLAEGSSTNATAWSSGLAVVDPEGTYVALVMGVSAARGPAGEGGWARDEGATEGAGALGLSPAVLVGGGVCGARWVLGGAAVDAAAHVAALAARGATPAQAVEAKRPPSAVNVVLQRGDALLSHADSRAGGLASRF